MPSPEDVSLPVNFDPFSSCEVPPFKSVSYLLSLILFFCPFEALPKWADPELCINLVIAGLFSTQLTQTTEIK
ncbi:hypothetical protein TYRP_013664 [Tyrophagus putrescentiae]|nr:hypothetical protein TYRP_013664 [Tyrophagus putrescentiae]